MLENSAKIVTQLRAVIQKDVTEHFSHGNLTLKGMEWVQKYAQEKLDLYLRALMKESKDLELLWRKGHPFVAKVHLSVETHSYAVEITVRNDAAKAGP